MAKFPRTLYVHSWEMKENILIKTAHPDLVLFDGVCNLCNASVQFILKREKSAILKFASLQSPDGILLSQELKGTFPGLDSIVLIQKGKVFTHSSAALRIAGYLKWPYSWAVLFLVVPKFLRDGVYRWIASNRYQWFGKQSACMIPSEDIRHRFLNP